MGGVANFAILTRHLTSSGPLPTLTDHAPNSEEYTYISSAISLAIRVMGTPQCQNAMTELAMSFDALWMHSTLFQGNYNNARQTVRGFVDVIAARFPIVCIDQRLTGSAVLGYHQRAPWNGQFNPRNQWVFINSTQARNMIQGAGTGEAFRIFQFKLACTLIHETTAHMLVTFLGRGGSTTPPGLTVAAYSGLQPGGESGRFLEMELFGGCLEFSRDPARGANHPGTPHRIGENGGAVRIPQTVVDNFVQYSFTLPFPSAAAPINPAYMQPVGQNPTQAQAQGQQSDQDRQMLALVPQHYLNGHRVRLDDVMHVPFNPQIRVRAA